MDAPAHTPSPLAGEGPEVAVHRRLAELAGPDPEENRELFTLLISSFVGRAPQALAELAAAARRGAALDTAKAAHTLRGEAASLGGTDLAGVLAGLEQRARTGALVATEDDLGRIAAELDALCRALLAAGVSWGVYSPSGK